MMSRGVLGPTLAGSLANQGYDVWMGNNRGSLYSNTHKLDGQWSLKEHWDFSWAEMGYYDLPAEIEKIREVTRKPKVTLVAYS